MPLRVAADLAIGVLRLAGWDNAAEGLRHHHGRHTTRPPAALGLTGSFRTDHKKDERCTTSPARQSQSV